MLTQDLLFVWPPIAIAIEDVEGQGYQFRTSLKLGEPGRNKGNTGLMLR